MMEQLRQNELLQSTGADRKGITEKPYFKIPIERIVWPLLHALIGVGNNLLQYIIDYGEAEIQCLERAEISLLQQVRDDETELEIATELKGYFDEHEKANLTAKIKERDRVQDWLERNNQHPLSASKRENLRDLSDQINGLQAEINEIIATINKLKSRIKAKKLRLESCKTNRKTEEESIVSGVDKILKNNGVQRGAYHGGALQGTGVIGMMEHAHSISTAVAELMITKRDQQRCKQSVDEIRAKCSKWGDALTVWDEIFRICQTHEPTEEDCKKAEQIIRIGMKLIRGFDLSITPKIHGIEAHVVAQMRAIPGGISRLMEYWMEHYHQTGSNLDNKHRHTKNMESLAKARLTIESRETNPQVQREIQRVENQHKTGKRKSTLAKEDAETKAKKERLDGIIAKDRAGGFGV